MTQTRPPATLAIVVGTLDRLPHLRQLVESVRAQTQTPYQLHVADAGSADGTIEYVQDLAARDARVVPHLAGARLGQARALNRVFAQLDTPLTCWLSDDNVVWQGGLDAAVGILHVQPRIGLVGLKVQDREGPYGNRPTVPYIGGISSLGVLNVNQGMLRTPLLQQLGGFAEAYVDYGIDPDLTMRVLLAGHDVAYTRQVAIHHYRAWPAEGDEAQRRHARRQEALALYERTFQGDARLGSPWFWRWKKKGFDGVVRLLARLGKHFAHRAEPLCGYHFRDYHNAFHARYVSVFDLVSCRRQAFYLVQKGRKPCPGSWSSITGPSATPTTAT